MNKSSLHRSEKDLDELRARLQKKPYDDCIELVERLSKSNDSFVRMNLAVLLADQQNRHAEEILIRLLHDRSYLVQVEAVDSLFGFCPDHVKPEVWKCMDSLHPLVRGYAYRYICWAFDTKDKKVDKHLNCVKEKNTWARIMLDIGLLMRGDSEKLTRLLTMFSRCSYLNQCAILNGMSDIYEECSEKDQGKIKSFLRQNREKKWAVSVEEAFLRLREKARE